MPNKWISHVKEFATKHKLKYGEALKHPQCKETYASISGCGGGASKPVQDQSFGYAKKLKVEAEKKRLANNSAWYKHIYKELVPDNIADPEERDRIFNNRLRARFELVDNDEIVTHKNPQDYAKIVQRAESYN